MKPPPRNFSVLVMDDCGHHSQKVAVCLGRIKGVKLHVISNRRWVPIRFSRHAASFQSYRPGATEEEKLETILRVMQRTRSDVLLPVVESGSRFVARHQVELARHIALAPFPSALGMDLAGDKSLFCEFLRQHGRPQPPTVILRSGVPAETEIGRLTFPALFKPATAAGGFGIHKFADAATLLAFLKTTWRAESPAFVQSFIPGHDVDCSVLCQNGRILAHTIQTSFLPRRHPYGSDEAIEFIEDPQTMAAAAWLMSALNWSGVAHIDLRRDERDGQVKALDLSPRYWNSLLGSLAAGVNFPHLSCLAALGIEFTPPVPRLRKFFTADAAVGHILGRCAGRRGAKINLKDSGLAYAFGDPGPRVFRILKTALSVLRQQ